MAGWTDDAAGNPTDDGVTTNTFDPLGRLTGTTAMGQARACSDNGDGTPTSVSVNGTTSYM